MARTSPHIPALQYAIRMAGAAPTPRTRADVLYEQLLDAIEAAVAVPEPPPRGPAPPDLGDRPPWNTEREPDELVDLDPIEFREYLIAEALDQIKDVKGQAKAQVLRTIAKLREELDELRAQAEAQGAQRRRTPLERLEFLQVQAAMFREIGAEAFLRAFVDEWLVMHPELVVCAGEGAGPGRAFLPVDLNPAVYDWIRDRQYLSFEEKQEAARKAEMRDTEDG